MTHPTDDSLKPCPFCGSQPEPAPYVLKCVNAYCEAQPSVSGGNDDECATAWNKRALLAEQARTEPHKAEDAPSDAAAVDVAGLMALILKFGELSKAHGTAIGLYGGDFIEMGRAADSEKAALESALRLALAARDDDVFTALDMSPDTFRTEGGAVNVGKLRAAIRHPADYLPPDHWLAAAAPKGTT